VFIDSCSKLFSEYLDDIVLYAWGNQEVVICPRNVLNHWNFDRGKIVIAKAALLSFHPGQAKFICFEDVLQHF
jgi:hypothetical protein